tara:strand:+ start:933 stop:1283 length:351 start_codon:yes stop_codon:yes gene_type:complete
MSEGATLYALTRQEYDEFMNTVLFSKRLAYNVLNESLVTKDPEVWGSYYASLCEYIAITYRFEELLDNVSVRGEWNEKEQCWFLEEKHASSVGIFAISEISCRQELLIHNVSLLLH